MPSTQIKPVSSDLPLSSTELATVGSQALPRGPPYYAETQIELSDDHNEWRVKLANLRNTHVISQEEFEAIQLTAEAEISATGKEIIIDHNNLILINVQLFLMGAQHRVLLQQEDKRACCFEYLFSWSDPMMIVPSDEVGKYLIKSCKTQCLLSLHEDFSVHFDRTEDEPTQRWGVERKGEKYFFVCCKDSRTLRTLPNGEVWCANTNRTRAETWYLQLQDQLGPPMRASYGQWQGGLYGQSQNRRSWLNRRWFTNDELVILQGCPEGWTCLFGRCGGFDHHLGNEPWFHTVPSKLEARGIDSDQWGEWMDALDKVQSLADTCNTGRAFQCVLTIGFVPYFVFSLLPWSSIDPFQRALRHWFERVNKELVPLEMYCKGFTFKQAGHDGVFVHDASLATIVFALTPKEVRFLKLQPVLQSGNCDELTWDCWALPAHYWRVM